LQEVDLYSNQDTLGIEETFDLDRHIDGEVGGCAPFKHGGGSKPYQLAIDLEGVRREDTGNDAL
jgi:hypothetical protein